MSSKKSESNLISSSSILILSGVVLGIACSQFISSEMLPYLVAVGLSGFLVYLVLDLAASRRELAVIKAEQEQVEERFEKHMLSLSNPAIHEMKEKTKLAVEPSVKESATEIIASDQLVSSA